MARSSTSGQGRLKGVPNKATADLKAIAQKHTAAAIKELARLATSAESEAARVSAIKELLDRGHGRSSQPVGGADDLPPILTKIVHEYVRADG